MSEELNLIDKIKEKTGWIIKPFRFKIVTDTTEWMNINRGDVIRLEGRDFVVRGNMNEPRFGIDDQPKYWVFSAIDLETSEEKIIKTVFNEDFMVHIGFFRIRCYRSQDKESKVLDLIRNDMRFMQGRTIYDEKGNNVRIIDYIRGKNFFRYIPQIEKSHYEYYHEDLPIIFRRLRDSFEAIRFLHKNGLNHGDIRNDHILIDSETGVFRWIDFDLNQDVSDFDLWSLGNILSYATAKGIKTFEAVTKSPEFSNDIKNSLNHDDASAFYEYRIMNHAKIYPYIGPKLQKLLMHFTIKPVSYYSSIDEFMDEFDDMLESEFPE